MSRTLNLVENLLTLGRDRQNVGRLADAFTIYARLARFRDLPADVAKETQVRLAEIQIHRRKYERARRHLAIALTFQPDSAYFHRLLGDTLSAQGEANWERAAEHYRRALALDPEQVECLTAWGLLAIRMGLAEEGLDCLRKAVQLREDDPQVLGQLVKGLRQVGQIDEARAQLRAAMFRRPRDRRFRKLYTDFQFQQLRAEQRQARWKNARDEEGPVLLSFTEAAATRQTTAGTGKVLRLDPAAGLNTPHGKRVGRHADKRQAR